MLQGADAYDEIPFPSQPLTHAQPARLHAIAALFGMRPAPAECCRVLELGCATAGNLIPLAERHSESRFVGIDYSAVQIEMARRETAALGLANLDLQCASIMDLDLEPGSFDYVICHGVYSWVPREVQDKILALCRTVLAPQGVAYVSYNTLPAWHLRSLARRLMHDAVPEGTSRQQVAGGRARLQWLAAAIAGDATPYGRLLAIELDAILRQPDEYLLHEYFVAEHAPLYFHEFADRATAAGLEYLGDSELATMSARCYGRATAERLEQITSEPISAEQHLDVLCNRGFRKTLLCQGEVSPARRLLPERLEGLYFSGQFTPRGAVDLTAWTAAQFDRPDGSAITHPAPVVKALLALFGQCWPRSLSIGELTQAVAELTADGGPAAGAAAATREAVVLNVVQFLAAGIIDPSGTPDRFTTTVSLRPQASRLSRHQAQTSPRITNARHETVCLDETSRQLLALLDGTRDQQALLEALVQAIERGEFSAPLGGAEPRVLVNSLQQWLTALAGQALLVS